MKLFKCTHCGQLLYFENNQCESCGYQLGFIAASLKLYPLVKQGDKTYTIYKKEDTVYSYCENHDYRVCNWLVRADGNTTYCDACDLNKTIPNLEKAKYTPYWRAIEAAKHRLVYALLKMRLPLVSKKINPETGLAFDFLSDENSEEKILTGHDNGLITLNIAEADDIAREMARKKMDEPYRTLLGHFRHEVGHYYWDRLIDNSAHLDECRNLFGDDRRDYGEALKEHYDKGAPGDWNLHFISAYASTHPWEDWAETWAHYLHIIDTLETAYEFGINVSPRIAKNTEGFNATTIDPYHHKNFGDLIRIWLPLTFAMNSLNRSMGHPDTYPFVIPAKLIEKLSFIHQVCYQSRVK